MLHRNHVLLSAHAQFFLLVIHETELISNLASESLHQGYSCVGEAVTTLVGLLLEDGVEVGCNDASSDGAFVGSGIGALVGDSVGVLLGTSVGEELGEASGQRPQDKGQLF